MHYYPFNICDYRSATAHLTNDEDLAYRRLLDMYYDSESPIPLDTQWVSRRLRVATQHINTVLMDFFVEQDDGWHHARCEAEIERYNQAKKNHWGTRLTKAQRASIQGMRNASKAKATPRWLTPNHKQEIAAAVKSGLRPARPLEYANNHGDKKQAEKQSVGNALTRDGKA